MKLSAQVQEYLQTYFDLRDKFTQEKLGAEPYASVVNHIDPVTFSEAVEMYEGEFFPFPTNAQQMQDFCLLAHIKQPFDEDFKPISLYEPKKPEECEKQIHVYYTTNDFKPTTIERLAGLFNYTHLACSLEETANLEKSLKIFDHPPKQN